jgi:hypothetical protein
MAKQYRSPVMASGAQGIAQLRLADLDHQRRRIEALVAPRLKFGTAARGRQIPGLFLRAFSQQHGVTSRSQFSPATLPSS